MPYLAKVSLMNQRNQVLVSEVLVGEKELQSKTLNDYQMFRALETAGITPKQKTKYDSWRDSIVLKIDVIKEIKGHE